MQGAADTSKRLNVVDQSVQYSHIMDLPPWLQHGCRVEIVRFHLDSTNPDCRHTTWFEPAKVVEVIAQTGKVHVLKHVRHREGETQEPWYPCPGLLTND